jgi:MFS transporter, ACS family, glucarate transporter
MPTRARHWVVVYAVTLAILSYVDRVAISQAAGPISHDLGFSKSQMGLIFGAFGISYALFEIPSGWLGDWMGARRVLVRIVLAWSAFTALTGAAWNFASMYVIRFLFGAGEAGCFPNATKALSVWLPVSEQPRAQGLLWAFARWGGAFTPPLVILAFRFVNWRAAFTMFGALGLIWCFFFYHWFRDRPEDHPSVNAGELELLREVRGRGASHPDVPWNKLLSSGSIWLLWAQYFCFNYVWYFFITWLPTYLQEARLQTPEAAARLAIIPLLFGGTGSVVCGLFLQRIAARNAGVARARRLIAGSGMFASAVLLIAVTQIQDPLTAMLVMGVASFSNDLIMPPSWNSCMDIGGKYAGTVAGSMNMMGNLGGAAAPMLGGILLDRTHNDWNLLLYLMAGVGIAGAICWPFIDPVTPLERTAPARETQPTGA